MNTKPLFKILGYIWIIWGGTILVIYAGYILRAGTIDIFNILFGFVFNGVFMVVGLAILFRKNWARLLTIVMSILLILNSVMSSNFFSTKSNVIISAYNILKLVLGIFSLWMMLSKWGKEPFGFDIKANEK